MKSDKEREKSPFLRALLEKTKKSMNVEELDEETTKIVGRMVVLRVATKHIDILIRQLEMKRREVCELAGLIGFEGVKKEIEDET